MTLEKIKVKNFLVFKGSHELELGPVSIFCSGENGAGKTTFFVDSIGYALFGPRAINYRGTVREIIAKGTNECQIEVIFTYRGRKYRVVRRHSNFGTQAELHRFEDDGRVVTEARGSKEVDEAIARLLGMNSETFFSTAVIRQGEIEAIVRKSPSEFRNMLLEIFSIDFTRIRERLKEAYSEVEGRLKAAEKALNLYKGKASEELDLMNKREELVREIYRLKVVVEELESKKTHQEKLVELAQHRVEELSDKVADYRNLSERREKLKRDIWLLKNEVNQLSKTVSESSKLDGEIAKFERLKRCIHELLARYSQKFSKLKVELETLRNNLSLFEDELRAASRELLDEERIRERLATLNEVEEEISKVEKTHENISEKLTALRSELNSLDSKMNELKSFMAALDEGLSRCPLCGAELKSGQIDHIRSEHKREYEKLAHRKAELEREVERVKNRLNELKDRKKRLYQELSEKAKLSERLRQIEARKRSYEELRRSYEEALKRYEEVKGKFSKFREEFRNDLNYCGCEEVSEPDQLMELLNDIEGRLSKLQEERENIRRSEGRLQTLMRRIVELEREFDGISTRLALMGDVTKSYEAAKRKRDEERRKLESLRRELEEERRRLEVTRTELKHCEDRLREVREAKREVERLEEEIKNLKEERDVYLHLYKNVFAEGKLPLLLLKYYIERVEVHAQRYLDWFMSGRFQIKLKLGRSGVEITISEGGRVRKIDSLSMGEKTAVGFALRLGLMSAIAEAKGVGRLNFLVIDEGLSAFDEERREAFLAALNELRREFSTLVVISHLPDIADAPVFDMLVKIVRGPSGWSRVEVQRPPIG